MEQVYNKIELPAPQGIKLLNTGATSVSTYHIFFIPGNPGLISYYDEFLRTLHLETNKLLSGDGAVPISIYGKSLGGFEVVKRSLIGKNPNQLGLQQQIDYVEASLTSYAACHQGSCEKGSEYHDNIESPNQILGSRPKIILVGHSVGAYIMLEVIRRLRVLSKDRETNYSIIAGICLFPTVIDIAKSPSGLRLGWLLRLPHFPFLVASLVRLLTWFIPERGLETAVKAVTGFPSDAARITTAFLRSENGVRQSLHMARDEMLEITADRWEEDVWGSATPCDDYRPPKLFFMFGRSDHWVADRTRDEMIAARALQPGEGEDWKPKMEIDETSVPHGFCIRRSSYPSIHSCSQFPFLGGNTDQRIYRP